MGKEVLARDADSGPTNMGIALSAFDKYTAADANFTRNVFLLNGFSY